MVDKKKDEKKKPIKKVEPEVKGNEGNPMPKPPPIK
jgi:hypothetical protein